MKCLFGHNEEMVKSTCLEKPEELLGEPIGMYHCPDCDEMVLAGLPHPDICLSCYKENYGRDYFIWRLTNYVRNRRNL